MKKLLAVLACAAAFPAAALGATATKKVNVGDDFYGPTKVTVHKGTTVKWVWEDGNYNSHDVKLTKAPKGVKKFHSPSAASDYSYSRKLTVPGSYTIVCTLHQNMKMTITVK